LLHNVVGVCLVQLDAAGKISRNEVYFDCPELLQDIKNSRNRLTCLEFWVASLASRLTLLINRLAK